MVGEDVDLLEALMEALKVSLRKDNGMAKDLAELKWEDVESTAVSSIAYNEMEQAVYVQFVRGAVYKYHPASIEDYKDLRDSASVGQQIKVLQSGRQYEEVET